MLDDGRSYSEIVHQISAVRTSLDRVIQVIVEDLVEDCAVQARSGKTNTETLKELQSVVAAIR